MQAAQIILVLAALICASDAADPSKPHPHQGILQKYERKPPSAYGLSLAGITREELRSGKPVTRLISISGGFKRAASIQEIPASPEVVWSKIMDLDNYKSMVTGVAECKVYRRKKSAGGKLEMWAKYKVGAGPFNMEYFMYHCYEPSKKAMTFCLDYERCSDFSDTVGYWYVEKLDDGWSRVYYSTDSQLPHWVPAFAKEKLMNHALRSSTSWVDEQCKIAAGVAAPKKGWGLRLRNTLLRLAYAAVIIEFLKEAGWTPSLPFFKQASV